MNTTLAEIVQKIASQGKNPDVSFLKDNPEAQAMLLLALLSSNKNNANATANAAIATASTTTTAASNSNDNASLNNNNNNNNEKRKFDSFNQGKSPSPPASAKADADSPKRVGRKPVTSDDEDSDNPKSKRKAQNRAAQRAFRERKENHVRILEERVKELEEMSLDKNSKLILENKNLKEMITRLQNENAALLGSTVSFDYPLISTAGDERPQKVIRQSSITESPTANFDSLSSGYSTSSKSRSNTPEIQIPTQPQNLQQQQQRQLTIDDILKTDLPSNALLDHSQLLNDDVLDYSTQLNDILNQHQLAFQTDPSQFDLFYPLNGSAHDILNTAAITLPPEEKKDEEIKNITKSWDKLSEHPRFDEIDMDILCDEMHKKATCVDFDHDKEMERLIEKYYPVQN